MTQAAPSPEFLTPDEAAVIVRMSPRTLENRRLADTGPRYYKMGPGRTARILYRREDLLVWMEKFSKGG